MISASHSTKPRLPFFDRTEMISLAKPAYQPQMDGLRALAVLIILLHHFNGPFHFLHQFGPVAVRFFFVLSGYLITRILLKSRQRFEEEKSTGWSEYGRFQMRRLIRTLPPYYLSILLVFWLDFPPVRETLQWTLPFLTNLYMVSINDFPHTISHFWSIAVQEQFYLVWPIVIFCLPKKWLKYTLALLILAAVGFRFYCIQTGAPDIFRWFSLLNSLDSFAIGGILAWVSFRHPGLIVGSRTRLWSGALALVALAVAHGFRYLPLQNYATIWIEVLEAAAMGWVVACSVQGFRGWPGRLLASRPLTYIGQVSYGIYVYHIIVSILLAPVFTAVFGPIENGGLAQVVRFLIQFGITLGFAAFSWHWFEQPILKLRDRAARWLGTKAVPEKPAPASALARR